MIRLNKFNPLIHTDIKTFQDLEIAYTNMMINIGNATPEKRLKEWLKKGKLYKVPLTKTTRSMVKDLLIDYGKGT